MNNKEASAYFRNEMLAGNGTKDVDLPKFHQVLGVSSDDPAEVSYKPTLPVATLQVPNRTFEIFDGREWKEVNMFSIEPGRKVVRITVKDGK